MANRSHDQQNLTASSHVLRVPELVHLICSFSDKKDYVNLSYLCRYTFACASPIVWEDVDLKAVLLLIPGLKVAQTLEDWQPVNIFGFPTTLDLTRLGIYGSDVKILRTATPYVIHFPDEWPDPGLQTTPKRLLPNLRRLIVSTFNLLDKKYVNWIPKLLAPSLKEFEMCSIYLAYSSGEEQTEDHWWISGETCTWLIDKLCQACPVIEQLHIFPRGPRENQPDNRTTIYTKLASLRHLHFLMLGEAHAGQELFQTLGQLQYLESLSIVSDWSEDLPTSHEGPIHLSDDSFPALRHLTLSRVDSCTVRRISDSPQLFRHLISASIIYYDDDELDSSEWHARVFDAMRCFGHGSPHLVDLTILTSGADGYFWLFSSFIHAFKQMPLRQLRLGGVDLNPDLEGEPDHNKTNDPALEWEDFLTAVPGLEELRLDNQPLELQDLEVFARTLPNLRLLALRSIEPSEIDWEFCPTAATQPITIRCRTYFTEPLYSGVSAYDVARCTHSSWPNAIFEASMDWRDPEDKSDSLRAAARWNERIEALRSGKER